MFKSDFPTVKSLKSIDAVIITGSWAFVHDKRDWLPGFFQTIKRVDRLGIPTLAICFGFQAVAYVFGGAVRRSTLERGFRIVKQAQGHPVFKGIPKSFKVYESHYDCVRKMPQGAETLAKNTHSVQAYQLRKFTCIQFHPEVRPSRVKHIAKREGHHPHKLLRGVHMRYALPAKILKNFLSIAKTEKRLSPPARARP